MNVIRKPILNIFYLWQVVNHCSSKFPAKTQWVFFHKSFGDYSITFLESVHTSSTFFKCLYDTS